MTTQPVPPSRKISTDVPPNSENLPLDLQFPSPSQSEQLNKRVLDIAQDAIVDLCLEQFDAGIKVGAMSTIAYLTGYLLHSDHETFDKLGIQHALDVAKREMGVS